MAQFSDSLDVLLPALLEFQKKIGAVAKDADNPFFKSRYASLKAVWDTVRPLLTKQGLIVSQFPDDEGLTTILAHTSGQYISAYAKLANVADPQKQASSITYMRRYALSSVLGLVTEEDDDGNAATKDVTARTTQAPERSLVKKGKDKWAKQT